MLTFLWENSNSHSHFYSSLFLHGSWHSYLITLSSLKKWLILAEYLLIIWNEIVLEDINSSQNYEGIEKKLASVNDFITS